MPETVLRIVRAVLGVSPDLPEISFDTPLTEMGASSLQLIQTSVPIGSLTAVVEGLVSAA
jgi:hypothetical protein